MYIETGLLHQQTKAKLRRLTVQRRNETWRQFCEKMAKSEYTKAIAKFSRIRKNRSLKPIFSVAEGPQHAANIMANHLQQTLSGSLSPENGATSFNLTSQSSQPFSPDSYPFSVDSIKSAIESLPRNKAPGIDHIKSEMIQPLIGILSPIFFYMFQLCWQWSYTPLSWRIGQIVPIYKKGSVSDPRNYRPISLTSIFRKILEKCIQPHLVTSGPPLDITQGGFRESRGSLDQVLCLTELSQIYRKQNKCDPVLAFLDIKSAYDTVDRNKI